MALVKKEELSLRYTLIPKRNYFNSLPPATSKKQKCLGIQDQTGIVRKYQIAICKARADFPEYEALSS